MAELTVLGTIGVGGKIISLGRSAKKVIEHLRLPVANRLMDEAGDRYDEIRELVTAEFLTRREQQAGDPEAFVAATVRMLADHQFARVQRNLKFEAIREATDERQRMLAVAAAGLCDVNLNIDQKARIERTLRALDPEDIVLLRTLAADERGTARLTVETSPVSYAALLSSGCLILNTGAWGASGASISALGRQVVGVLEDYKPGHPQ